MPLTRAEATAPRRRPGTRPAIAALLLSGSLLTGCQANPEPPPLARTATSTSSSPSPTEAAPTMPPEARGTSKAAAEAFVRYYIGLINYAAATGETQALLAASNPGCRSCTAVADRISSVYERDGSIESRGWRIFSIHSVPGRPRHQPMFDLGLRLSPQEVTEDHSAKPKRFDGGRLPATFSLERQGSSWRVLSWERAA